MHFEAVLGRAVLHHIEVAVPGVEDTKRATWVGLVRALVESEWVVTVAPESHVDEPRFGRLDVKREMVEGRTEHGTAEDLRRQQRDLEAEGAEQGREQPVALVAEPTSPAFDDLLEERDLVESHGLAEVDAQVLERDREEMAQLDFAQVRPVDPRGPAGADASEIRVRLKIVDGVTLGRLRAVEAANARMSEDAPMDRGDPPSIDLLEVIRAALDELEPMLGGRTVDIETARLHVLAEPASLRGALVELIRSAIVESGVADAMTLRVVRAGTSVRIELVDERSDEVSGVVRATLARGGSTAADG
jgi:cell pole-organizing protein PopZ